MIRTRDIFFWRNRLSALPRLFHFLLFFSLTGCSLFGLDPSGQPALEHTVDYRNETVSMISRWYTGTTRNASAIRTFNHLGRKKLKEDDTIWIPDRLVIRRDPMPRRYIATYYADIQREHDRRVALAAEAREAAEIARARLERPEPEMASELPQPVNSIDLISVSKSAIKANRSRPAIDPADLPATGDSAPWMRAELDRDGQEAEILRKLKR